MVEMAYYGRQSYGHFTCRIREPGMSLAGSMRQTPRPKRDGTGRLVN